MEPGLNNLDSRHIALEGDMPKMIPGVHDYDENDDDLFSGEAEDSSDDEEVGFGKGARPKKIIVKRTSKRKRRSKKGQGQHRRNLWTAKVSYFNLV
jgi:hypothetical protein